MFDREEDGFKTYSVYIAVRNHFRSKTYNFRLYNGKTRVTFDSFMKRKDRWNFVNIKNKHKNDLVDFLIANLLKDPNASSFDLLSPQADDTYKEWSRRITNLQYCVQQDCEIMVQKANEMDVSPYSLFVPNHGSAPKVLSMQHLGTISSETVAIFQIITNFITITNAQKKINDPLWDVWSLTHRKYALLFEGNNQIKPCKTVMRQLFQSANCLPSRN